MRNTVRRLTGICAAFGLALSGAFGALPGAQTQEITAAAATTDYPVQLARISTADNSRNLNISGYGDNAAVNTWTTNGVQNENWRFDYVGSNSVGRYYKLTNMGTGRLLTPKDYNAAEGTQAVIYGSESAVSQHWYVTAVAQDSSGTDLYYKITNYSANDLALTYQADSNTVTLSKYTGADSQKWLINSAGLQGFAGYAKDMNGKAKASDIGGLLGETVEVTTFDELKAACGDAEPRTIVITKDISKTGTYTKDSNGRYGFADARIYLWPNKTIIGSYAAHSLYNVYFRTYGGNYGQGSNIIIRNIEISHDKELNNDNIWEFAYGRNFWIDHCTFVGHDKVNGASTGLDDWDKFLNFKGMQGSDGNADSSTLTDMITISDCNFGLHEYAVLLGYPTDTDADYRICSGKPCVTLADNYYHNCLTRAPGLMRYGYFHSFNNYVYDFSMAYTVHSGCHIYAESCYYDGAATNGNVICDWNEVTYPGAYAESGSYFTNCRRTTIEGSAQNCTWRPTQNYSYSTMTAAEAKSHTVTYSGAQKSASAMTYAAFAETGVPSAGYVTAPDPVQPSEPLSGRLIASLEVLDTEHAQSWSIHDGLALGDSVYGDREVTYAGIPREMLGAETVLTACDGKTVTGNQAVLTLAADAAVFVAVDSRVTAKPSFLDGFALTGTAMLNSSNVEYVLYSKRFSQGDRVTLGANGQSAGCVNYTVFAAQPAGDVNADGSTTIADARLLVSYLTAQTASLPDAAAADLSGDGKLNGTDLTLLKRLLMTPSEMVYLPGYPQQEEQQTQTNTYEAADFRFSGTVYLVGDSTVCDYSSEINTSLDRYGWGQKLPTHLNNVTVKNLALSGRSSRSFLTESNYSTLCSSIGKGDYLFIQFGHNDEKTDESAYPGLGTFPSLDFSTLDGSGKNSSGQYSYEWILLNKYIKVAQNAGAQPVLVTPITRRGSNGQPNYSGHVNYQNAMIALGKQYQIPVIDATALTTALYNEAYASGGADATAAFHCWTAADHSAVDNTHLSSKGATEISGIITAQVKALGLALAAYCK